MNHENIRNQVHAFSAIWFPSDGSYPKFWFRARDNKYRAEVLQLCEKHWAFIKNLTETVPLNEVEAWIPMIGLSAPEQIILAIMLDQIPRNALAIGYGDFCDIANTDVKSLTTETFSRKYSECVLKNFDLSQTTDERIICFFSLIFRHANHFTTSRSILALLKDAEGILPPLALKFMQETDKREASLSSNTTS